MSDKDRDSQGILRCPKEIQTLGDFWDMLDKHDWLWFDSTDPVVRNRGDEERDVIDVCTRKLEQTYGTEPVEDLVLSFSQYAHGIIEDKPERPKY